MEKITYEIEFITPAFIGGANQQAELRPASFVGLLRWWWRVLKGQKNTEKLFNEESEIFGNQKKAGKVWVRIRNKSISVGKDVKSDNGLHWYYNKKIGQLEGKHAGIGYLFFSAVLNERDYLTPGSGFVLEFVGEKESLLQATASLWALATFGGVGTRARRGGGNIQILNSHFLDMVPKEPLPDWLRSQYISSLRIVQGSGLIRSVYVSKAKFKSWIEALNDIGKSFMEYRSRNKRRIFEMGAFGLPIRYRGNVFLKPEKHNRRASPLILKIIKVEDGYRWMAVWLDGKFLPNNEKLEFKGELREPNLKPIEEFLSTLDADVLHLREV